MPHQERIQRLFGRHDLSSVRSHEGADAASAARAIGARAFAVGDSVAFAGSPSLHTAAHEAAHVIQQRHGVSVAGGMGRRGDRYEQHADAVADLVVRGRSAEGMLDRLVGGGSRAATTVVQREEGPTPATCGLNETPPSTSPPDHSPANLEDLPILHHERDGARAAARHALRLLHATAGANLHAVRVWQQTNWMAYFGSTGGRPALYLGRAESSAPP